MFLQGFQGLLLDLFLSTSVLKNPTGVSIFMLLHQMSKPFKTWPLNSWQLFEGVSMFSIHFFFLSELVLHFAVERIKQTSKACHLGASHCAKHWGTIIRLVSCSWITQTNRGEYNLLALLIESKKLTSTVWINSLLSEFLLVHLVPVT